MSVFTLFAPDGSAISLDAVTDISKSRSATTTSSTIFNGATISDHYRGGLPMFSVNGVCVAVKSRQSDALKSPTLMRKLLDDYIDSETLFRLVDDTEGVLGNHSNIVISDYSLTRNAQYGDSLLISMTLMKLDISSSVQKTTITKPNSANEGTLSNPDSRTSNGKTTENSAETKKTVAKQLGITIEEAFSSTQ